MPNSQVHRPLDPMPGALWPIIAFWDVFASWHNKNFATGRAEEEASLQEWFVLLHLCRHVHILFPTLRRMVHILIIMRMTVRKS